jgi:hypothetical protein
MGFPADILSPGGVTAATAHHGSVSGCSVPATTRNMPPRLQPSRFYRACLWLFLCPGGDAFFFPFFFPLFFEFRVVFTVHIHLKWRSVGILAVHDVLYKPRLGDSFYIAA